MVAYMNLHLAFEQMRVTSLRRTRNSPSLDRNEAVPDGPPRVLVLGPENAGKTSACKVLVNYAVRAGQGWAPMFVNVDPSEVNAGHVCPCRIVDEYTPFYDPLVLGRVDCPWDDLCVLN